MATPNMPDFTQVDNTRKDETGQKKTGATLTVILATFLISAAQAQVLDEQFTDALQMAPAPATTADWDVTATEIRLPTTGTINPGPVQSLTGALPAAAPSSAFDVNDSSASRSVAVVDLNGDGLVDLAFGNNAANRVYLNDGAGVLTFSRAADVTGGGNTRSVKAADFNGDGHMDLLFAEFGGGQASRINFNNGGGVDPLFDSDDFVELGDPGLSGDSADFGDVDNDGDIDVVLGFDHAHVQVFKNDGFGNFSDGVSIVDGAQGASNFHVRTVMLGDLDGDGDLDIVAAREEASSRVYLNDGNGTFGTQQSAGGGGIDNRLPAPDSAALGDVNGDGLPDLIVGNDGSGTVLGSPAANYLFINSGNPADVFPALSFSFTDAANTNDVELADLDKDGDLDIVTADFTSGNGFDIPGPNRIYLNDGAGNFPANGTQFTPDSNVTKSVESGDFDGDGDLDLIFGNEDANASTAINRILENEGVLSGVSSNQLYAAAESLSIGAGLGNGVFLDPVSSAGNSDVASEEVFQYWLSDDDGLTWITAHRNRSVAFPSPVGNTIKWRVEFNSSSPMLSPAIGRMLLRVNAIPSFTSAEETAATQDAVYTYDITTSDSNGDLRDIRPTAELPGWLTLTDHGDGTATLTGTPLSADVIGPNDVEIEVIDGARASDSQVFTIVVEDVNDMPTLISPTGDRSFDEGTDPNLDVGIAFLDFEGDPLTYSATGLPASLSVGPTSGILSGTLTNDDVLAGPDYIVVITATDATGSTGSTDDTFTLTVNDINFAPEVTLPGDQNISQGTDVNLDVSPWFDDIDGDALTFSANGMPASLSIDTDGNVTGLLTQLDAAGSPYAITVTATEVGTADMFSVEGAFNLTVSNAAPTFTSTELTAAVEGTLYTYSISAADANGDAVVISAGALPGWLSFTSTGAGTAELTGTPSGADVGGDVAVTLTASDGLVGTNQAFTIAVASASEAPVITIIGAASVSIEEGTAYVDAGATATDEQDGDITVEVVSTVDTDTVGTYTVTYTAEDSAGNMAQAQIRTVEVTAAPPPPPPPAPTPRPSGGGGGSTSLLGLLLLAGLVGRRRQLQLNS
jgi:hypothetical protein